MLAHTFKPHNSKNTSEARLRIIDQTRQYFSIEHGLDLTRTRLDTDLIGHGPDQTWTRSNRQRCIRTRIRLCTDSIAHRLDCTPTRLRTDSNAITIKKTGKILVDDEKI